MQEPAPTAFFEQFGDSTLNLNVRFFLAKLDLRLPTRHELLVNIRKKFAEAGIEVSFPQRDLHIKTLPKSFADAFRPSTNENEKRPNDNRAA
jgi:potassium efflux system protein